MSGLLRRLWILLQDYLWIASLILYLFASTSSQNQYDWYPVMLGGGEQSAEETARLFLDNIVQFYGIPRQVVYDRDPRFTSLFWKALFKILGSKLLCSLVYHPQTDGRTKYMNEAEQQVLCTMASDVNAKWVNKLSIVEFAINSSVNA